MRLLHLTAIAAICSSPALATDLSVTEQTTTQPDAQYDWSGAYIGAHLGYGWSAVDWIYQISGRDLSHTGEGRLGGLQAGYNWQTGNWVYGVEADFSFSEINGETPCPNPAFACESEIDWLASGRLRLGYAIDNILVYGTGGIAAGSVTIQTTLPGGSVPNSGGPTNGTDINRFGFAVGTGLEWGITRYLTAKVEYMHYDLGNDIYATDNNSTVNAGVHVNAAKFGLNYKF